jgi:hypothetical protein
MSRHHVSENAPPCPRCLALAVGDAIRIETLQPVPEGAWAPLGPNGIRCCYDCASADTLMKIGAAPTWEAARIAVGNDRQEQYRMPGVFMGLVGKGLVRPSDPGDFERQLDWLDRVGKKQR